MQNLICCWLDNGGMKNTCRHEIWKTTNCIVSVICVLFLYLNILTMDIFKKKKKLAQNRPF